jgi:hypothetical protein
MSEHNVEGIYYRNRGLPELDRVIECSCGFVATGDTWEDAGREYDQHLEEEP